MDLKDHRNHRFSLSQKVAEPSATERNGRRDGPLQLSLGPLAAIVVTAVTFDNAACVRTAHLHALIVFGSLHNIEKLLTRGGKQSRLFEIR